MLKRVGECTHPCRTPTVVRNHAAVEEDCTYNGLVIEVFNDSDKVAAVVIFPHSCPQRSFFFFLMWHCLDFNRIVTMHSRSEERRRYN